MSDTPIVDHYQEMYSGRRGRGGRRGGGGRGHRGHRFGPGRRRHWGPGWGPRYGPGWRRRIVNWGAYPNVYPYYGPNWSTWPYADTGIIVNPMNVNPVNLNPSVCQSFGAPVDTSLGQICCQPTGASLVEGGACGYTPTLLADGSHACLASGVQSSGTCVQN